MNSTTRYKSLFVFIVYEINTENSIDFLPSLQIHEIKIKIFEFQLSILLRVTASRNLDYNLDQFSDDSDENKQTIE